MLHYLKHINEELNISKMADTDFDNLLTVINSHEYIFTKIPIYNFSISKLKNKSNLFYDLKNVNFKIK